MTLVGLASVLRKTSINYLPGDGSDNEGEFASEEEPGVAGRAFEEDPVVDTSMLQDVSGWHMSDFAGVYVSEDAGFNTTASSNEKVVLLTMDGDISVPGLATNYELFTDTSPGLDGVIDKALYEELIECSAVGDITRHVNT